MEILDKAGAHGKLPSHSDFVSRGLMPAFVSGWDDWLQRGLACSQERLGPQWLDIYLTSPVWRFVLSSGVVDTQVWAGVMIPSVDRVGRYYPFTVAWPLPSSVLPTALPVQQVDWFGELETVALAGLQDGVTIDALEPMLARIAAPENLTQNQAGQWEMGRPLALFLQQPGQNILSTFPVLQHSFLMQRFPSYSLWWSAGSERVSPAFLTSAYLPPPQSYTAMLAGDWEQRGWSIPFGQVAPLTAPQCSPDTNDTVQNE